MKKSKNDVDAGSIHDDHVTMDEDTPKYHLTEEQEKRYRYLLGDSELFDRFIEAKRLGQSPLEVLTSHAGGGHGNSAHDEATRRHRKTEREEDAAMLHEAASQTPELAATFNESPSYVEGGKMRPYQIQGLNWLISLYEHRVNGILADEMGLGKTLQTLSLLGYLKHYRHVHGPHLLVVPKSTLQNWANEAKRWIPTLRAFIFHGTQEDRQALIHTRFASLDFDLCITSYEMCLSEKAALRKIKWQYLVIDEAHRIKNEASKLAVIVREFHSSSRLLITGTPLQNNLHELWALLNFLLPDIFTSADDFDSWFESHAGGDHEEMVKQLRRLLQPFLLRRLKADVEHSLLPKKEVNLYVGMSGMQRSWYRSILERDIASVNGLIKSSKDGKMRLLNIMMQLRKCCNHPYLFDGAEPGPPFTTDQHLVDNSGKMQVLDRLLARFKANGSRVLLFSQMSRMLDILEDYCVFRGYSYCRIDGQTAHEDRIEAIDEYNRPGSDKFIFLLTTRAGGLGINLATADIVIIYDSDWNPQVDLQAQDRAHRIGQTKQVCVFRLLTENSVDEKILEKAVQKLRLDQLVIQQGKLTNVNKALSQDEMLAMIRHGAEQIFQGDKHNNNNQANAQGDELDIEEVLRKGEEKTKELNAKYQNVGYDDLQKFAIESTTPLAPPPSVASSTSTMDDAQLAASLQSQMLFLAPGKRERARPQSYGVDNYFKEALRIHPPKPKAHKAPMPKGVPTLHDFQFYPNRLHELVEREIWAFQQAQNYQIPISPDEDEEAKVERESEQALIDSAVPLSEAEMAEKEKLLAETGFPDWTRKEYYAFLRALEHHGKEDYEALAEDIETKTPEEVKAYSKVFWSRLDSLKDADRIEAMMAKTEERLRRTAEIQSALDRKVARHAKSRTPLSITYSGGRGREYTEEEDTFLITNLTEIGYSRGEEAFEVLRDRVLQSPLFRFDWFIKTRSPAELQRRCQRLISYIEKEMRDLDAATTGDKKKKAKSSESAEKEANKKVKSESTVEKERDSKKNAKIVKVKDGESKKSASKRTSKTTPAPESDTIPVGKKTRRS